MPRLRRALAAAAWIAFAAAPAAAQEPPLPAGFEGRSDLGAAAPEPGLAFDAARGEYTLRAGAPAAGASEALALLWRRDSGDLRLSAEVRWPTASEAGAGGAAEAGWVVRQGLEPGAPQAAAVVRADGRIALRYRLAAGGPLAEIASPIRAPAALRLERTGDLFTLYAARDGATFQPVGGALVPLRDPVHAGLGVAPAPGAAASAVFARVAAENLGVVAEADRVLESTLEVLDVATGERRAVYTTRDHIEAPNWSRDGASFIFNSKGLLYALPREGGVPRRIETGAARQLNNDHGLSFDGRLIALSDHTPPDEESRIYVVPAAGGEPRQVTELAPSYWHGWSPDGKTLVYCAKRGGEFDVYAIDAGATRSREERRLTTAPGLDDGPEYAPDGKTIYFNSVRSGHMRIWAMNPDGSEQRMLTHDEAYGDWFAHPSPDGAQLVFVSFDASVEGHPENKPVALRLMPSTGGEPRVLARLFGGQGTLNVPSWSPDGTQIAFVSYRLIKP